MKRNLNLSVYKLLGYLLLAVSAIAFVNASNTNVIATAPVTEEQPTQSTPNRHTITLVLSQLLDLKVEEGQRINAGDIIRDRTTERTKLQAKRQRLADSLTKARLPLNALKPVPSPSFQTELVTLKQAQFNLDAIVEQLNNFDEKLYFKDPWHVQVFESEKGNRSLPPRKRKLN